MIEERKLNNSSVILTTPDDSFSYTLRSFKNITIRESAKDRITEFGLKVENVLDENIKKFNVGSKIEIKTGKKGGVQETIFKGVVTETPKSLKGITETYDFKGTNQMFYLQRVLVNESYVDYFIHDIFKDLINKHKAELRGVVLGDIQTTDYTLSINFKNEHLYTCLERIADAINFTFHIDKSGFIHFYKKHSKVNERKIKNNDFYKGSAGFSYDNSRLVNRLMAYGGESLSDDLTQTILGDGYNSTFLFNYTPRKSSTGSIDITLNGTAQKVGIEGLNESNVDVIINVNARTMKFVNSTDGSEKILASSDVAKATYRYEYPLIVQVSDKASINEFGLFEDVIKFPDIKDRQNLIDRTKNHLNKYKNPILSGSLKTWLNDYEAGELVDVFIETKTGTFIESTLEVTSKGIAIKPNVLTVHLNFDEKEKITNQIKEIRSRLKQLESSGNENEIVEKYEMINESFKVEEAITHTTTIDNNLFIVGKTAVGNKL